MDKEGPKSVPNKSISGPQDLSKVRHQHEVRGYMADFFSCEHFAISQTFQNGPPRSSKGAWAYFQFSPNCKRAHWHNFVE